MNRIIKEKNKNRSVAAGIILLCSVMLFGCGQNKAAIFLDEEENTKTEQTSGESETREAGFTQTAGKDEIPEISPTEPVVPTEIFVDVCGAVVKPGVYEMEADSRVFQAIEAAGGMLPEASGNSVNQAQPVSDGQQIYVPTKEEIADGTVTLAAGNQQSGEAGVQETESGKPLRHYPESEMPRHRQFLPGVKKMEDFPVLRISCRCRESKKVLLSR